MRIALVLLAMIAASPSRAEDRHGEAAPVAASEEPSITDYCANFADQAHDARVAWQSANLRKLEDELASRIAALETKKAEIEVWIGKREAMLKSAAKELVDIYAKMDPEAAAGQLAELDTATATSVIRQLSPRGASAIMNVMEAKHAARLAKAIANATLEQKKEEGT